MPEYSHTAILLSESWTLTVPHGYGRAAGVGDLLLRGGVQYLEQCLGQTQQVAEGVEAKVDQLLGQVHHLKTQKHSRSDEEKVLGLANIFLSHSQNL